MPFNYQAFGELKIRVDLGVLGLAMDISDHRREIGKANMRGPYQMIAIPPGKINYWARIASANIDQKDISDDGRVPVSLLVEKLKEDSDIPREEIEKRLQEEDLVIEGPTLEEIDILYEYAKSRGHDDIQFYSLPSEFKTFK